MRIALIAGVAALSALATSQTFAALYACDEVSAPQGTLVGAGGGSGWRENWNPQDGTQFGVGPGLTYSTLQTTGNAVIGGGGWTTVGRGLDVGNWWGNDGSFLPVRKYLYDTSNNINGVTIGADGTTVWASMLLRADMSVGDWEQASFAATFHDNNVSWAANTDPRATVGLTGSNQWALTLNGATASTGVSRVQGQVYLAVLKMDFAAASDTVTLWINPALGGADPTGGTSLTASEFHFRSLGFYPNRDPNKGAIDEIRLGSGFADVTPVPEPAVIGALAIASLGLIRRRRTA